LARKFYKPKNINIQLIMNKAFVVNFYSAGVATNDRRIAYATIQFPVGQFLKWELDKKFAPMKQAPGLDISRRHKKPFKNCP
jgi:hypothetical protein